MCNLLKVVLTTVAILAEIALSIVICCLSATLIGGFVAFIVVALIILIICTGFAIWNFAAFDNPKNGRRGCCIATGVALVIILLVSGVYGCTKLGQSLDVPAPPVQWEEIPVGVVHLDTDSAVICNQVTAVDVVYEKSSQNLNYYFDGQKSFTAPDDSIILLVRDYNDYRKNNVPYSVDVQTEGGFITNSCSTINYKNLISEIREKFPGKKIIVFNLRLANPVEKFIYNVPD